MTLQGIKKLQNLIVQKFTLDYTNEHVVKFVDSKFIPTEILTMLLHMYVHIILSSSHE